MKEQIKKIFKYLNLYGEAKATKEWVKAIITNPKYFGYNKKMYTFYNQFISSGELCFDIGANIGERTEIFLRLGAKVVAVEPQESCIKKLESKYKTYKRVFIVRKALGEKEGNAELMLTKAHTIASMSKEWIAATKLSGRFDQFIYNKSITVQVTTLDKLITQYGIPEFCKIDVEGFEYPVLLGLSRPIRNISFEFIFEFVNTSVKCIEHLYSIGFLWFNYSVGESMTLSLGKWVNSMEICKILLSFSDKNICGDIYACSSIEEPIINR